MFLRVMCIGILALANARANAGAATIEWPTLSKKVICGGRTESGDLDLRINLPEGLLAAESEDGRVLLFIDLRKPGLVKFVMGEFPTDAEFEARERAVAKLTPEEATLLRQLSTKKLTELLMGFGPDRYVHYETTVGKRRLSISCQEQDHWPTE